MHPGRQAHRPAATRIELTPEHDDVIRRAIAQVHVARPEDTVAQAISE